MKSAGLFDAKNRLSEICESVATTSEPVTITRRGKPLVRIVPIENEAESPSVWDSWESSRQEFGEITEAFELPTRSLKQNRKDPLG